MEDVPANISNLAFPDLKPLVYIEKFVDAPYVDGEIYNLLHEGQNFKVWIHKDLELDEEGPPGIIIEEKEDGTMWIREAR